MSVGNNRRFGGNPAHAGREKVDSEHHVQVGLLYALCEAVKLGQSEISLIFSTASSNTARFILLPSNC